MKCLPNFKRLQQLQHLCQSHNFHRTAEALHIAQPALSRSIRLLEEELGFVLFERTTRSIRPTKAAEHLVRHLDALFPALGQAILESQKLAKDSIKQRLALGYSAQAANGAMPGLLFDFGLNHAEVELGLLQAPSEILYQDIATGQLDAGFMLRGKEQSSAQKGKQWLPLETQPLVALCSIHSPLAQRKRLRLSELNSHDLVLGSPQRWGIFRDRIGDLFEQYGVVPRIVYEPDDTPILLESIVRSQAVALYGAGIVNKLPSDIVALPFQEKNANLELCFAWRPDPSETLTLLIDFIKARLSAPRTALK